MHSVSLKQERLSPLLCHNAMYHGRTSTIWLTRPWSGSINFVTSARRSMGICPLPWTNRVVTITAKVSCRHHANKKVVTNSIRRRSIQVSCCTVRRGLQEMRRRGRSGMPTNASINGFYRRHGFVQEFLVFLGIAAQVFRVAIWI